MQGTLRECSGSNDDVEGCFWTLPIPESIYVTLRQGGNANAAAEGARTLRDCYGVRGLRYSGGRRDEDGVIRIVEYLKRSPRLRNGAAELL